MSSTTATAAAPPPMTESEAITLTRPEGITDGRWKAMHIAVHKVVTGHYPWCSNHQGDPASSDSWCQHTETSRVADILLSSGTLSGAPMVYLSEAKGVDFEELSLDQASVLAGGLAHVSRIGTDANVTGSPR